MRDPSRELSDLAQAGLLRRLSPYLGEQLPQLVTAEGETLLNFSSNDYLGLAQHPALKAAAIASIERFGTGATASRLVCGTHQYHREVEEQIATLKQSEKALLFANGYTTAVGAITALVGKGDTIILDKLSHACLIDGARLSGATLRVFPHNNLNRLEELLKQTRAKAGADTRILVVTESVFSMDGDCCPLREIISLKNHYGALLLLDEAHALGVMGPRGLGLAEELNLQSEVDLQMGTLGKAAGSAGGYLAASANLIDLMVNKARSFIYSTAPPPAQVASASAALDLITSPEGATLRHALAGNIRQLQEGLQIEPHPISTPIVPLILGSNETALAGAQSLRERGFLVPAIRYPTVPKNTARLRVTLSATHSREQIAALCTALTFCFATSAESP